MTAAAVATAPQPVLGEYALRCHLAGFHGMNPDLVAWMDDVDRRDVHEWIHAQ